MPDTHPGLRRLDDDWAEVPTGAGIPLIPPQTGSGCGDPAAVGVNGPGTSFAIETAVRVDRGPIREGDGHDGP